MAVLVPRSINLDRYVKAVPGKKNRWWFRRRVPRDLVKIIGEPEWRCWLDSRNEDDAKREGLLHLVETDRIIKLAMAGDWPALDPEQLEALATGWWSEYTETVFAEIEKRTGKAAGFDNTDPRIWALRNMEDLELSVRQFLEGPRKLEWVYSPERDIIAGLLGDSKKVAALRGNMTVMAQLLDECQAIHHAIAKRYTDTWQEKDRAAEQLLDAIYKDTCDGAVPATIAAVNDVEPQTAARPVLTLVLPIRFNDPDDEENDLIGKWARIGSSKRGQLPGAKTVYEARRMMRKLEAFVGFDDLRRLTRKHVQDWIDHLRQTRVKQTKANKSGKLMAPMTVSQHLIQLKGLCNFAVERDIISVNPAERVHFHAEIETDIRAFTNAEARVILEAARKETADYKRWLPWLCCFMGCRLDEPAGAAVADIEQIGSYWVLNIRLDFRHEGASIKTASSVRKIPLHRALLNEGFIEEYVKKLPKNGSLFPSLKPDKFGSKGGTATKRVGPIIRGLAKKMPSLADKHLSPSHSWRHRLHEECRRLDIRVDVENAITGHAQEGEGPGYGEYAITVLGPAIDQMRSPFDAS